MQITKMLYYFSLIVKGAKSLKLDRSLRRLKEEESKRSSDGSRFSEECEAAPRRDFESEILALRQELMRTQGEAEEAR